MMILAVNWQFFPKGPKSASDKLAFLYGILTKNSPTIIQSVTESNQKALCAWAFVKPTRVPRKSTITYLPFCTIFFQVSGNVLQQKILKF